MACRRTDGSRPSEPRMRLWRGTGFGIDTFGIGEDTGQPVTIEYKAPWPWSVDRERRGQLLCSLPHRHADGTAPAWLDPLELIEKL